MKIHILQTGSSKLKRRFVEGKGKGVFRILNILFDKNFIDCPYYNYLIEHPEGLILVDTGESAHSLERSYYPFINWNFIKRVSKISVSREDEIDYQLKKIGYSAQDVKTVIITHLHQDHIGGLKYFSKTDILVSKIDYEAAFKFGASLNGYMSKMWPQDFKPKLIQFSKDETIPFGECYFLTKAKDIMLVPTYGHSTGSISVIFKDNDFNFLFCGDATFRQELFLKGEIDGVCADYVKAKDSLNKIKEFCQKNPTILLPSHDPGVRERLSNKTLVFN